MDSVLSIDIGNTRTHMAAVDTGELSCVDRIDFENADFDGRFVSAAEKIASAHPQIRKANITSCVKDIALRAKELCAGIGEVNIVAVHEGLPISVRYEDPRKLGTDRLCNALACAALFEGRSCVIIGSGTAVTVDFLRDGKVFEGGAILPGCAMQAAALHRRTDALPLVGLRGYGGDAVKIPATSTEGCISAGILFGTAGAVERCAVEYLRVSGGDTAVVATGGGWEIIRPLIAIDHHRIHTIRDLTLIGAAVYG